MRFYLHDMVMAISILMNILFSVLINLYFLIIEA